jgi:hypothetical protein
MSETSHPTTDPPAPTDPTAPIDWAAVRRDYETSDLTVVAIHAKYKLTPHQLTKRRKAEIWAKRYAGPANLKAAAVKRALGYLGPVPDSKAALKGATGSLVHRKALLRRLFTILDLKITELDARIARAGEPSETRKHSDPKSGAESERDARMLAHVLKTYEQLCDLADVNPKAHTDTTEADDVDRLRADVRERIERLARFANPTAIPAANPDRNAGGLIGA